MTLGVDSLTITVDVRERRSEVPTSLEALGMDLVFVTLAVGDYAVGERVVERKAVADLHASLESDRIWGQVGALRRDPRRAYLIVEGHDLDAGPVAPRALRGALFKIADNGIRLLRTASSEDSALWLSVLARPGASSSDSELRAQGRTPDDRRIAGGASLGDPRYRSGAGETPDRPLRFHRSDLDSIDERYPVDPGNRPRTSESADAGAEDLMTGNQTQVRPI